jgi:hypothetical protein
MAGFSRWSSLLLASALVLGCGDSGTDGGEDDGDGSGASGGGTTSATGANASSSTGVGDVEPPGLEGITDAHNAARASVDPPASPPIPPLAWSPDVAAVAQAYAENCVFEHSDNDYGENLYATTGQATPQEVVGSWVSEVAFYDYEANTCSDVCGHYTQVVWAESLRLGCGFANCTTGSPFGSGGWQLWVCNYDPPGNFVGERPY